MVSTFIGTMGAFIRLGTIVSARREVSDVGVAGSIAGSVVSVPVLVIGLMLSHAVAPEAGARGLIVYFRGQPQIPLGDSLLTFALRRLLFRTAPVVSVDPVAFAGWVGMLVTMLNLVPMSQLDGGHILYATAPRWHQRIALAFWILILALGAYWWGWVVWGVLVLALSRGRLRHPAVLDAHRPLPRSRRVLAWAALALLLITFAPVPVRL